MNLTEMLKGHRTMWDWLVKHPRSTKKGWYTLNLHYPDIHEIRNYTYCFPCAYAKGNCVHCPMKWDRTCNRFRSVYHKWYYATSIITKIELAKQIRDVPLKQWAAKQLLKESSCTAQ